MSRFRQSLASRIFIAIAATAVLTIAIMALQVALSMRDGFAQYLLRGELTRFDDLERALVLAHEPGAPGWPELASHPKVWNDFVRAHFQPLGSDGFVRPGAPPGRPFPPPDRPPPGAPAGADNQMIGERLMLLGPDGRRLAGAEDQSGLFERRAICSDDDCTGDSLLGFIGLNAPLYSENASDAFFLRRQYVSLALSAFIAVLVSAAAAFFVARQILIPIRQLDLGAKTMASGDYTARIAQDRKDELGQLIGHYNALAATLERTDKAEREWISNTSHELQTPLATLRAQIEAVQDGIRQPDAQTLAGMHSAMMRLSRLVQDIKTLSHSREGGLMTAFDAEDLSKIVREAIETAQPQLEAKQISLDLALPDALPFACDQLRIRQVIDNLLQNAIRYTNTPGRVRLRLHDASDRVQLIMDDTPPAPPQDDLPRLFDRFYRAESSRSRAYGGSGLGLSVCKAIIAGHGGKITAEPSDLGGLRIIISLPRETT
ncbi:ATP-binding protein [Antarctobacter heliothermus]|uniref:histidine kinase n=1 Tax=Antarctobacter heliothermus TaxID=74033 RepID=A0A239FT94_9RHOB|nr:ATP-binding protein [Antarctobacter heliothermus]SNS59413.1 two-component system, OmpR family, sensor histidine kinase BaeS [Antarctobacter heliothermus]